MCNVSVLGSNGPMWVANAWVLFQDELMSELLTELVLFLRLAQAFRNRLQMPDRDRALVLGGSYAALLKMTSISAFCKQLILQNNHGHMIRKWDSFEDAIEDSDFVVFLKQVRRRIPVERAETLLIEFGYNCDVERTDYQTDVAFAAAVMGVDDEWLNETFGPPSE